MMNSIDNPIHSSSDHPWPQDPGPFESGKEPGHLPWLEIFANVTCWIGITGLILLITHRAWADPSMGRGGFSPGVHPSAPHPHETVPGGGIGGGALPFYDDEDDEDFDEGMGSFAPPHRTPPSNGNDFHSAGTSGGPRVFPGGGTPDTGPAPVRTKEGFSVGGSPANGVVSTAKTKGPLVKIDTETAEGSKDLVTDFNFPDADILDIAKTLGKLTGKNFILDKDVKGRITIISNSAITVGEAWKVFLTALDINGFALIPSGKYLRIARQRDARDKQLKTYVGEYSPDTDALITRVFTLKYISPEEVARTFRSFMPATSRIIPYEQTNTVIVTDTGTNIAKLAKMLEILDVEGYDAGIEVIPVKYASAAELSKLIDTLIPGTSTTGVGGAPGAPRFGGAGGRFSARRTKEGGIINTIISDDRTNTLIVHANTKGADQVRELVAKLDQKNLPSHGGGKVHVYYLQFADAEQVANTLNNFSTQAVGARSATPPGGGPGGGTGVNPIAQSLFEGSIKIAPDKSTNALVITASPSDYVTVQRVINKLDIPRNQVYVEVAIMEVAIGKNFDSSVNIINTNPVSGLMTKPDDITSILSGNYTNSAGALIGIPFGPASTININGTQTNVPFSAFGLVKALQGNSNTNILATPQVVALDNTEATFESSDKIPIATNTVTATGLSQQSATKEPVVLSIKIKPQINKITNFVKMDVTAKMSNVDNSQVPAQLRNISFGSTERTAQTTVVVGDSDTVVLGGLVRDRIADSENKVPLLGDIPILGWLFKSKSVASTKNNLLIFMTPHIVRQYDKVRAILDRKLKERDEFLEATTGGQDPMRQQRDAIIRSLPDLHELTKNPPPSDFTLDEEKPTTTLERSTDKEKVPTEKPAAVVIPPTNNTTPAGPTTPDQPSSGSKPTPLEQVPATVSPPAPSSGNSSTAAPPILPKDEAANAPTVNPAPDNPTAAPPTVTQ